MSACIILACWSHGCFGFSTPAVLHVSFGTQRSRENPSALKPYRDPCNAAYKGLPWCQAQSTLRSSSNEDLGESIDSYEQLLEKKQNEGRIKVWKSRRKMIRNTLKASSNVANFREKNNLVPSDDQASSKLAITVTAFFVAIGALVLRLGGRAALISGLGLDFIANSDVKDQMDSFLSYTDSLGPTLKPLLFIAAWTGVKISCLDAGGIVLALGSGVLFGGIFQGAFMSAFGATIGSLVAFSLAKVDTPFREKALELIEEFPSLRGIEKVVANDGAKAIMTLRLAPVLPIPIGMYNYVYGVTSVPATDFAIGIFVGSLKPYLLDSYLGYYGKSIIDGSSDPTADGILLLALGISILVGVFASQLAGETWEAVQAEIDAENEMNGDGAEEEQPAETFFGFEVPLWIVGMQIAMKEAEDKIYSVVEDEYEAGLWKENLLEEIQPQNNPANYESSPEISDEGFPFVATFMESVMLSPVLFSLFVTYSDPTREN